MMEQIAAREDAFVIPISYGTTEVIDTGKWGFQKPHTLFMTAPCREACPAGNNISKFLYLAQKGAYDEALLTILKENPFPGICGRVCFHPCEGGCNRGQYDESVSVSAMERYIFDVTQDRTPDLKPLQHEAAKTIAVVGAGPAGLSCAYFLTLLGHKVTLFESREEAGGVMRYGIPEYRLPRPIVRKEIERIVNLGVTIRTGIQVGRDMPFDELYHYDAIFLAIGAGVSTPMGLKGEATDRVIHGLRFLEKINAGVAIAKHQDVLVIGGGNTAMDAARSALRHGNRVVIAYRRGRAEMPAVKDEIDDAEHEGARIDFLIQPIAINELPDGRLAVTFQRMQLGDQDGSGRRRAIPVEGATVIMEADYVVAATGEGVETYALPPDLARQGLIHVGSFLNTADERIFAGGDAVDQPRTIVTAIGAGKKAALSIDLYLKGQRAEGVLPKISAGHRGSLSFDAYWSGQYKRRDPFSTNAVVSFDMLNTLYFEHSQRIAMRKLDREAALESFQEVNLGFTKDEATASASRCFSCGMCNYCYNCYFFCPEGVISLNPVEGTKHVDYDHCKGCGTCAKSCPRCTVIMKEL
jgi:NADPH-dependent glutamate synthase beta subunit-like oxidoreductase